MISLDAQGWAMANFGGADLGDRRREKKADEVGGGHG
jgi:hypothetical protein